MVLVLLVVSSILLPAIDDGITVYSNEKCNISQSKAKAIVGTTFWYKKVRTVALEMSLCDREHLGDIFVETDKDWEKEIVIQSFNVVCKYLQQKPSQCYDDIDVQTILDIFVKKPRYNYRTKTWQ